MIISPLDCHTILRAVGSSISLRVKKAHNDGLQRRRAGSIQAEGIRLLEKHAIAPSAARLCWARAEYKDH